MEASFTSLLAHAGAVFAPPADVSAIPFNNGQAEPGVALHFGDATAEYAALTGGVGVADFTRRTQIELRGADRASFLHNLSTNEIRKLAIGAGCEAFLTNAQAHILAFVSVWAGDESIVLETVPDQETKLLAHLDRYLIREKVELHGRSQDWAELLVAGPRAAELLAQVSLPASSTASDKVPIPSALFGHCQCNMGEVLIHLRRVDLTGPVAYLVSCDHADVAQVWAMLRQAGAAPCGATAVEMARIEAGTPYYGPDISDKNLPQEVARNARAISFTKGCYLGQEPVARIDALGHVNRTLCGLRMAGDMLPPAGTELTTEEGQPAGLVTSAASSPRLGTALALAYVRRGSTAPGTKLHCAAQTAEVVTLPL